MIMSYGMTGSFHDKSRSKIFVSIATIVPEFGVKVMGNKNGVFSGGTNTDSYYKIAQIKYLYHFRRGEMKSSILACLQSFLLNSEEHHQACFWLNALLECHHLHHNKNF